MRHRGQALGAGPPRQYRRSGSDVPPPAHRPPPAPRQDRTPGDDSLGQRLEDQAEALRARARGRAPKGVAAIYANLPLSGHAVLLCRGQADLANALAGQGSGDFAFLLGDTLTKLFHDHLAELNPTYEQLTRMVSLRDFKPSQVVTHSAFPGLRRLGAHGEYQYGDLEEAGEPILVERRGRIVSLSREAIVNDDIRAFDGLARSGAQRVAADANALFWALVRAGAGEVGPTMADGDAFFDAAHGNLVVGQPLLGEVSFAAATAALRNQTALDGTPLNLSPRFLVVGPLLEVTAQKLLADLDSPVELLVEPAIDVADFYVWGDPAIQPAFIRGTLNDSQPWFDSRAGFEIDGVEFKLRTEIGFGGFEWRAAVKVEAP